jgi:CheY-like chemotaxis protein
LKHTFVSILLVGENGHDLDLYSVGLPGFGFAVTAVQTAEDASFIASVAEFDALVLSFVAPDDAGWQECEALRNHTATGHLPMLILSTRVRADRANGDRAQRLGCAAFVTKPCTPEHLAHVLRRTLAGERFIEDVGGCLDR